MDSNTYELMTFLGSDGSNSEVHLGRMLQILREFSADPVLSMYVIDDVWEYMMAMKVKLFAAFCIDLNIFFLCNCGLTLKTNLDSFCCLSNKKKSP